MKLLKEDISQRLYSSCWGEGGIHSLSFFWGGLFRGGGGGAVVVVFLEGGGGKVGEIWMGL